MRSLSLHVPHLIIMVGIPGAGKTFFAKHFSDTFNIPFINVGTIRHQLLSRPTYSKNEDVIVGHIANYALDELLKTGKTVIYEGFSGYHPERDALVKKAKAAGYEAVFVWVQTESATSEKRFLKGNPGTSVEQFKTLVKQFKPLIQAEGAVVISGKHTYASQVKVVLKRLIKARTLISGGPLTVKSRSPQRVDRYKER